MKMGKGKVRKKLDSYTDYGEWEKIAISIAEDAFTKCDSDDAAIDYISERIKAEEIEADRAYEIVTKARGNDPTTFKIASDLLIGTKGHMVKIGETIDNVIVRLAYWIMYEKAFAKYCVKKEIELKD